MYKPNFQITSSILNAITEITEARVIVERSRVLPLNEAQLRRQAIVRMAHTSTSIEGNPLAEYQVDKVLSGMSISADQRSILEVKNYQKALQAIEGMSKTAEPLKLEEVLKLHELLVKDLLPPEKTGHFRPGAVYVIDELGDGRERVRFVGPDAKKVLFLVNELLTWLAHPEAQKIHPIIRAGIFHLQFVTIHPFSDGNGRLTRLLTTLILYKAGWDFRKIIVLEDYYNRDRQAYYNAENQVQGQKYHEGEDLTPWLEYFVEGFLVEARKVMESIQMIGYGRAAKEDEQVFLDADEIKIMDFLSTTGRITSNDVMDVIPVAKRTAQLKLKTLVDKGLVEQHGKGPSSYYILKP